MSTSRVNAPRSISSTEVRHRVPRLDAKFLSHHRTASNAIRSLSKALSKRSHRNYIRYDFDEDCPGSSYQSTKSSPNTAISKSKHVSQKFSAKPSSNMSKKKVNYTISEDLSGEMGRKKKYALLLKTINVADMQKKEDLTRTQNPTRRRNAALHEVNSNSAFLDAVVEETPEIANGRDFLPKSRHPIPISLQQQFHSLANKLYAVEMQQAAQRYGGNVHMIPPQEKQVIQQTTRDIALQRIQAMAAPQQSEKARSESYKEYMTESMKLNLILQAQGSLQNSVPQNSMTPHQRYPPQPMILPNAQVMQQGGNPMQDLGMGQMTANMATQLQQRQNAQTMQAMRMQHVQNMMTQQQQQQA